MWRLHLTTASHHRHPHTPHTLDRASRTINVRPCETTSSSPCTPSATSTTDPNPTPSPSSPLAGGQAHTGGERKPGARGVHSPAHDPHPVRVHKELFGGVPVIGVWLRMCVWMCVCMRSIPEGRETRQRVRGTWMQEPMKGKGTGKAREGTTFVSFLFASLIISFCFL